jgi:putative phage-type endonuclease
MKKHNNIIQGTEEWHHIRKGKMTGTTLKAIMGTPKARQDAMYELIAERLTIGVETDYENPMDRGTRLEPEARAAFEFETGKTVEQTGFAESDENSLIGYSPDGLIANTDDTEDLEIKSMGGKNHVKMWLTNKVPDEYYWQVVQAFVVNKNLKKRYFVGYNPDIPLHPLHIIEVTREAVTEDIKKAEEEQERFLSEVESELSKIITL